jgi:PAS domain S-box-containing protein
MVDLIKSVSQPMIVTSADRRLLHWNAAFTKLTGYNNKELGDPIISAGLTAPEWHDSETKAFEKLQHTGKSQIFQKEYIRKDGSRVPVEVLLYQFTDDKGKVRYYVGLISDVSEHKQSEETLQKSESHYRILVENAIEGIVVIQDGEIKFVNPIVAIVTGYSREELQSMSLKELLCPDNEKAAIESISKAVVPGTLLVVPVLKIRTKVGEIRLLEATIISIIWDDKNANLNLIRDITERKQAEETLSQSERKYQSILDDTQEGYWEIDLAGNFTSFNDAICRIVGYDKTEMMGMSHRAYTGTEYADKVYQAFNQVYRTGKPIRNMNYEIVQKDGSTRFAETSVFPRRNDKEEIIGFRGVSRDIAERKNMEETLRRSEERYRTILEEIQDAYFEVDLAGNYTFANEANCHNVGYPREELLGRNYRAFIITEDADKVYQTFNNVYITGQPSKVITFHLTRKDGSVRLAELAAFPLRNENGEIIGFRGIGRDVTERLQVEETLRRSEERYRTVLEEMEEGYYETDINGNYTFFNDAICKKLGYSREELMGMNFQVHTEPEDVKKIFDAYYEVARTGKPLKWFPPPQIRKDGARIFAEDSVSCRRNESGEIIGYRGVSRDVTERKQMEEALRQSEEKHRSILETIEESYYEVDLAGSFTFVNDTLCRQLRYSREELMGMNYKVYTPPEIVKKVFQAYNQVYRTGEPLGWFPMEQIRKDGTRLVLENSILPIRNEKGEIIGFRGVGRDITERLRMEEALGQSEKRYRTILEDMQEAYFEVDLAGNYTMFNDAQCRQVGYSREEMTGISYKVITPPDKVKEVFEIYNRIYRTGEQIDMFNSAQIRKDGTRIPVEYSAFPIRNEKGEIIGFRGVGRDISKRLQMEETLRRSEEKYRTVLENMKEPYYEMDLTGNYTFFNDALCRHLGYSREELLGMSYRVYVPPEKSKEASEIYNRIYRTGEPAEMLDVVQIRKDGKRIFVESSASPIRNEKDEIIGFRGVIRDVSERKKAEEERKQLEQKAQFASRLASVGELASGVAHEINNPLTGVIGYAHLLLARKDISRDVRRDLEIINEGAQRVAGIVKKLLAFARQTKPEQRYVNINELIHNTLDLRAYELAASNIKVSLQLTRDMPMTIADPGQLQQVFLNLIINAETEMKLTHDKGRLSIKTEEINSILRITFKDTGPGIAKENLETIFDPFFTTREVGQGTGLGLSVCHGIVTEHKGKIWAESEPGKGATFIVELPLITEETQSEPPEPATEEPKKIAKAKILVVDDEPVIREFVSQVLGEQGHHVETANNAADALMKVKSKRYRLILLDIKMPGMSGIELYRQFQKIAPSLTKRVVFITGDVMGKRTLAFLDKTKTPYMMKPFDAKQLKAEINRILARK